MAQVPVVQTCSLPTIPQRPGNGHKGTFGRVLVLGGSGGMSGAVCLASVAALRSGSGLVTAAVPCSIQTLVAGYEPCVMTRGLAEEQQQLKRIPPEIRDDLLQNMNAVCCGPGLGRGEGARGIVADLLTSAVCPLILDADALNVAAERRLLELPRRAACVITPHPGEFSRLTGTSIPATNAERDRQAIDYAGQTGTIVVLKGPGTVVTDGRRIYRNTTGNSGMATGGSGDVLAGMVVSLLGQGIPAFEAAAIAVHAHGLAGDFAAEHLTERGMIASDLLRFLPHAWRALGES
ncbi:MAG: Nicotinamide nucleotide repair protein [Planctomycetota bacterium]|jgi:ADP-dependent NAD(P)H-hydrate dehydratase